VHRRRQQRDNNWNVRARAVDWQALQQAILGEVVLPGALNYESVRRPALARFASVRPAAIVLCRSPADVAATLALARRIAMPIAIRGGGHSVAGRSSTEGIVLDVRPMAAVKVDNELATVGSGVLLEELYDALDKHGRTIPAGCGPSVGIAGLTLGGGIGILGRKYGLTCDHLVVAQIVLADGRVVECDEHQHKDLFWALRGAGGGNFGVVTSFIFRTIPAPEATVFHLVWPGTDAADLIDAWQRWAPTGPDELDATLRVSIPANDARPRVEVVGTLLGTEAETAELLADLVLRAGAEPDVAEHRLLPYRMAKRSLEGDGLLEGPAQTSLDGEHASGELLTKSDFFRRQIPPDAISHLIANLTQNTAGTHKREIAFLPWGGAYNRVAADATAFPHRKEQFLVQHLLELTANASASDRNSGRAWLARSWAALHRWASGGVYPNFPDPDLDGWEHAYFGENYDRLVGVKAMYDPENFFRFHQSLPTRFGTEGTAV
jgi:FAD binding domain/Berberine and berberine like